MNNIRVAILLGFTAGVVAGASAVYKVMALEHNDLVRKYNMIHERSNIQARVFEEIWPVLPDDFTFSEQSQIDIAAWTMFKEADL